MSNTTTINERFCIIKSELFGGKNRPFAQKTGISEQELSNICNDTKSVGQTAIFKVLSTIDCIDANWLILGEGNMLKGDSVNQTNNGSVGGDMIAGSKNYTQEDVQRLKRENEELRNQVKQLLRISESLTAIISKSNDESTIRDSYDALAKEI